MGFKLFSVAALAPSVAIISARISFGRIIFAHQKRSKKKGQSPQPVVQSGVPLRPHKSHDKFRSLAPHRHTAQAIISLCPSLSPSFSLWLGFYAAKCITFRCQLNRSTTTSHTHTFRETRRKRNYVKNNNNDSNDNHTNLHHMLRLRATAVTGRGTGMGRKEMHPVHPGIIGIFHMESGWNNSGAARTFLSFLCGR